MGYIRESYYSIPKVIFYLLKGDYTPNPKPLTLYTLNPQPQGGQYHVVLSLQGRTAVYYAVPFHVSSCYSAHSLRVAGTVAVVTRLITHGLGFGVLDCSFDYGIRDLKWAST